MNGERKVRSEWLERGGEVLAMSFAVAAATLLLSSCSGEKKSGSSVAQASRPAAVENVVLPRLLSGGSRGELIPKASALLESVGLKGRDHHHPDELSGGEMQRVAVARALLGDPALLLADEPTGNLDSKTGAEVLRLIREATRARNLTVVMVTHDSKAAEVGDRIVRIADGKIVGDELLRTAAA